MSRRRVVERIQYKTADQILHMRRAGLLIAQVHAAVAEAIKPGIKTRELDELAETMIREAGAIPNFKGYMGYPATLCVSVNEEIIHGIPGDRVIEDGDIVSVDGGCIVEGWHSDSAVTTIAGSPRCAQDTELVEVTRNAMWDGIAAMATARRVGEIGAAVEDSVFAAVGEDLQHLEDFGGHGIGSAMHQPPDVMNFRTDDPGPVLKNGMCLAIEPMLVIGDASWEMMPDEWTVVSASGARSAHWEHSVAYTREGLVVLTAVDGGAAELAMRGINAAPDPLSGGLKLNPAK